MNDETAAATPFICDLVLIGGGHAHVHLLKMYGMNPWRTTLRQNGIRVTLVSSTVLTPYSGMLPGLVAGHYIRDEIHLDLRKLCSFSGIRFVHAAATGITYDSRVGSDGDGVGVVGGFVSCSGGRPDIRYDALSIDVGSSPSIPDELKMQGSVSRTSMSSTNSSLITPVKPISSFSERWEHICLRLKHTPPGTYSTSNPFTLVVVGAGAGGIELALAAQYTLNNIMAEMSSENGTENQVQHGAIKIILATKGSCLLRSHNQDVRDIFSRILEERKIEVRVGAEAVGVINTNTNNDPPSESKTNGADVLMRKKSLKLSPTSTNQPPIYFDECLWCTSAGASSWLSQHTPFDTTQDGFVKVRDTYECVSHPGIFAAGDCCHMVDNPRPKAGVFAVRAGPILRDNLIQFLLHQHQQPLTSHVPQTEFMGLITTGDKYAVASRGKYALEGEFMWRLKDEIDRNWMGMYQKLPNMEDMNGDDNDEDDDGDKDETNQKGAAKNSPAVPPILAGRPRGSESLMTAFLEAPMRCGGCGAKVGSRTLSRVLDTVYRRRMSRSKEEDGGASNVPRKIDPDDAAIIMLPKTAGGAMIQTIDFFRSFISDPFIFGKIAAVHALSDCHAMGAKPQTALALAVVQFAANEAMTERTLVDMLSGASDILDEEDCELAGGHTCEGAEQALGFSVSGFIADPSKLLRKRGGRIGDKIVLTKAIGTGAVFASDMRAKCHGESVEEAIESMVTSNVYACRIAMEMVEKKEGDSGIHSCTDVTGFGLIGHLLEMLVANDDSDEDLDSISASLDLDSIPFLKGAIDASNDKITSSLHRENFRARRAVSNHVEVSSSCPIKYPLLFDPQTAGGLLFFVSPDVCDDFVHRLSNHEGVKHAAVIGALHGYQSTCEMDGQCTNAATATATANRVHINY